MRPIRLTVACTAVAALLSFPAFAEKGDRDKPIKNGLMISSHKIPRNHVPHSVAECLWKVESFSKVRSFSLFSSRWEE